MVRLVVGRMVPDTLQVYGCKVTPSTLNARYLLSNKKYVCWSQTAVCTVWHPALQKASTTDIPTLPYTWHNQKTTTSNHSAFNTVQSEIYFYINKNAPTSLKKNNPEDIQRMRKKMLTFLKHTDIFIRSGNPLWPAGILHIWKLSILKSWKFYDD